MVEIQHLVSSQIQSIRTKIFCIVSTCLLTNYGSSHPEVFLGKGVLKIGNKFTGEHPCRSAISIKLQDNFIEITLRHGCSSVNLLYIFRTPLGDCSCLFFKYYYHELKKNLFYVHFNPLATNVPII